ncbi:hypothetical protein HNQ35_001603 [Cerasibacillus quisquiliarum]|uniref:Uncharacterized protein n=1 Tax=Cerasibacillus quisquiliarum TaxID=227865 RepID=A0A511UY76_9BACI|nr:hypothetical protein [Cerasibacillus quisquiliarum]MBB5146401.1 hypothetical protein [Cerasibacillus quisquiliarum]GEN30728.1 hypothetical protein CQU01_09660 [Cerasibacillus quisquiliarum]
MNIIFPIYSFIVFFVFNILTHRFCVKLELSKQRQDKMFRFMNMIVLILLITSYIKIQHAII